MARGAPSQWVIGSQWIADGGIYPGMGDSIGLAGTSPELVEDGLWNDGGAVGDPPFDSLQAEYYNSSIGAGADGGAAGISGGGASSDLGPHILAGAITAGVLIGGVYFTHHRITNGQSGHSPIRWTLGEIALVSIAAAAGLPVVKTSLTWLGSWIPIFSPVADYVNGA